MPYCDICNVRLPRTNLDLNVYSHLAFKRIHKKKKVYYYQCDNCKLIYNKKFFLSKIFKSKSYIFSNQTRQKKIIFNKKSLSRAELQSKKFEKYILNKKEPSILDIGSFDGLLLKEFEKRSKNKNNYKLFGYDINKSLKLSYKKNINFITNIKKLFDYKYDLIISSHSIMYIDCLKKIILLIKNNLKTNGTLIIQFSNLERRPMNLLLADQYIFPSEFSLNYIFEKIGLYSQSITSEYFKNENILIFNKKFEKKTHLKKKPSLSSIINNNKQCLLNFKKKISKFKKFYIFGTTLEASVIHDFISENNKINLGFIDENSTNKKFRNLNIFQIHNINKKINIIFPYNNMKLKKRIENIIGTKLISIY